MKAIRAHGPGSPAALKVEEVERPIVSDDSVLVRVRASSANPVDLYSLTPVAHLQRSLKPGAVGTDFAGTVESVGKAVTLFRPGDEVFGGGRGAIGANRVIDYTNEDFTQGGEHYGLMLDIAGNHSWPECKRVLDPGGSYVGVGAAGIQHGKGGGWRALGHFLQVRLASIGGGRNV